MEKQIWKYIILPEVITHLIPKNAKVLHADEQQENIYVWVEVDPSAEMEERSFEAFGTGDPIPHEEGVERKYISTCKLSGGTLVFHIYERIE
jgi:hypothetical protein